ncbi:hypothetical protein Emtol_3841 [Emticicia oligotrophica DSM 17448]|uniref:LruC domain-containing protein n=1 Tax=Emticicia oligotrophica (strain DSM 17448 / CIP 109782 / MTCC 6937 / GPTSA100-15) TaxID=929562 RepID=A0ABM5N6B6_EMTOG|nr:LruC domain-containing protein [Emticicia oligotrophica]AFK04967.1 hypothetical protein Emtol_3841 [Emticicia oligotrophica DSM 17448]
MKNIIISIFTIYLLSSCLPKADEITLNPQSSDYAIEKLNVPATFDFKNSKEVKISVSILNGVDKPLKSIPFTIVTEPNGEVIFTGMTDQNGLVEVSKDLGNHIKQLSFKTDMIGIPNSLTVNIESQKATFKIGGSKPVTSMFVENETNFSNAREAFSTSSDGFEYEVMGKWNSSGVPEYLEPVNETITTEFLQDINSSLPESKPLTGTHPEYLKNDRPTTLVLNEKAEVWITFVHEGAGWQNSLGFYKFDPKAPPKTVKDVDNAKLVFPNVSFPGSGGGLVSGSKVKIGTFDKGEAIGFFLLANAFQGKDAKVGSGYYTHFSHSELNVEKNSDLRRHFVVLDDTKSNRMLVAVEDVSRESTPIGCDNDFNDAIFYVTSNPVKAIENPSIPPMDTKETDTDGDGVNDTRDEFPKDKDRAFSSYTPSKSTFGTLAYEDLWPSKGDYDFNDLVLNYQFQEITNAKNEVVDIKLKTVIKAVGASFRNGWGFELPIDPSKVKKVSGQSLLNGLISTSANGTEVGSNNAVIMVFDDAFDKIKRVGADFINTVAKQPYSQGDTMNVTVELTSPVASSTLGAAPYNPFIVVNKDRGKEVHLPNYKPTEKANTKLFGTLDDRTNPSKAIYYKNFKNLPWAIHIPVSFDYPYEKTEILKGYNYFGKWAESNGVDFPDWYLDKTGYRVPENIYKK